MKDEVFEVEETGIEIAADVEILRPEDLGYQDSVNIILENMNDVKQSFIRIGWYLRHIREQKLYREDGYQSIVDFAEDKIHMSRSTVFRLIKLCEKFSENNDSPRLDGKYEGYTYSQLIEILPMQQETWEKITPDMPVKKIRELKKEEKMRAAKGNQDGSVSPEMNGFLGKNYATADDYNAALNVLQGMAGEQPDFPELVNQDERKRWLHDVEAWGLWHENPDIEVRYYKYDFPDGSRLIAEKYRYTCPPDMYEEPEKYREEIEADGSYYGDPIYHLIYSEEYWEQHIDEYSKKYEKHYTRRTASVSEVVKFLKWIQDNMDFPACKYIEFDTVHLEDEENKDLPYVTRRYIKFYREHGYIPRFFKVKNCSEVRDYAPTLTTSCGSFSGLGSVVFFYVTENIRDIMEDHSLSPEKQFSEAVKLLRIASPEERERIKGGDALLKRAEQADGEIGKVRFRVSKLSVTECFRLMGLDSADVEKAEAVGVSRAQLYKEAGNGIVTDSVEMIMEHLYKAQYDSSYVCKDERLASKESKRKK